MGKLGNPSRLGREERTFESCRPDKMKTFEVKCYLCEGIADLNKMTKWRGKYFHRVKIPNYKDTCLEAAKKDARRR